MKIVYVGCVGTLRRRLCVVVEVLCSPLVYFSVLMCREVVLTRGERIESISLSVTPCGRHFENNNYV